ncbi:acyltransferase [Paenibacillus sp. FSL R5-0470]|uniref:acyltransferase family protein n=1 Tax=Paenibacillus sp. FSL R5-0470 TaxID=2921641 RepID=UPI0030DB7BA6
MRLNSLQSMRGIAALTVLFFHATLLFSTLDYDFFNGVFQQGYAGVDLFFVISGFVIYYIHKIDIGVSKKGKAFFVKRFLRVYPIYWLILVFLIPVYFLIPSFGDEETRNVGNLIKSVLLIPQPPEHMPLTVAWTLSHEILFYLMFGSLIILKKRASYPIIIAWLFATLILFLVDFADGVSFNYWLDFLFNAFNLEFLGGLFAAHLILNNKNKYGMYFIIIGLVYFILSWGNDYYGFLRINRVISYGIPSFLLIYGMVSYEVLKKIRIPKVFVFLGDASYSIYLIHYPLLSVLNKIFLKLNIYTTLGYLAATLLVILLTIIISCVFHTIIEKPLLNVLNRHVKKRNAKVNNGVVV